MKPVASQASNGYPVTSPLLDALSSAAISTSTAQSTNDWAKSVPAFTGSGSPGNLITLGDSPPKFEEAPRAQPDLEKWRASSPPQNEIRAVPHSYMPASSPPLNNRRPLSFQLDGQTNYEEPNPQKTPYPNRRSSMYGHQPARFSQPLPHQPQPHFYSAPDIDLGITSKLAPGEKGYYCGFDHLPLRDSNHIEDVLLVGYEGGMDIFRVEKNRLSKISTLDGLRGGVVGAKILPWTIKNGQTREESPLVALVVHGIARHSENANFSSPEANLSTETVSTHHSGSTHGSRVAYPLRVNDRVNAMPVYETTVEIYSLGTKELISTLLSVPTTNLDLPIFTTPEPSGALHLSADGSNLVISSGQSGEVFIFRCLQENTDQYPKFHCLGKIWTAVKHTSSVENGSSANSVDGDHGSVDVPNNASQKKTAILSLRGRWLAYSPPVGSPQQSLRSTLPGTSSTTRIPGFNTYQAPTHPPSVNCGVDLPDGESVLNRVARATTQEVIKGARWVSDQGFQAWNSYWSRPSPQQTNGAPYSGSSWQAQPQLPKQMAANNFPPTHGAATSQPSRPNVEPNLVSIIDLEKLPSFGSHPPQPLVTFKPKGGCSFLSFSPSGLALFTANSTGDAQYVWDLMRIQYTRSSLLQGISLSAPHVRQIAVFTRMTAANVTDVVWSLPLGERLAIITERRTAHILDLKESAFLWPPPRRKVKSQPAAVAKPNSESVAESGSSGISVVRNAAKGAWNMASPIMGATRIRSSSTSMSAASITAQAGQGGKAIAGVISKSFGAAASETVKQLRKPGETRLYLPGSSVPTGSGCARWLGRHSNCLAVVSGQVVRTYSLKPRQHSTKRSGATKHTDLRLPPLPDAGVPNMGLQDLPGDFEHDDGISGGHDMASQGLVLRRAINARRPGIDSPIPHAEIESNAPYQPFHTDRRVALYVYSQAPMQLPSPSVSALLSPMTISDQRQAATPSASDPWVFGRTIHTRKLDVGQPDVTDDDDNNEPPSSHIALPADALQRTLKIDGSEQEGEQIVITTRRRKDPSARDLDDDDGFFEDDCDVLDFASQRV